MTSAIGQLGPERRRRLGCVAVGFALMMLLTVSIAVTGALTAIWPGVFEHTAGVVCPAGYDEPLVVRDTYRVRPGETTTTFTVYCVNARGEAVDVGVMRSVAWVFAVTTVVLAAVVGLLGMGARRRRRRRRSVVA